MNEPLVVEQTYNAAPSTVWKALSDPDQMKLWYFDIPDFKPEVGFEFSFTGGKEDRVYIHHCRILEVIQDQKLKHSWSYEGYEGISYVTFELIHAGKDTRIRLTHEGLESFPKLPDFDRSNFQEGWTMIIGTLLKNFVEEQSQVI